MQAISLRPQHRLLISKQIVLAILTVLMAAVPVLCLPLAILMPLFSCPLIGHKEQWTAYLSIPVATAVSLVYGMPALYAFSLVLVTGLPVLLTVYLGKKRGGSQLALLMYMGSYAVSLIGVILCCVALFGPLPEAAAQFVRQWLMQSPKRSEYIYKALASGLLPVPEGYTNISAFTIAINPLFLEQIGLEVVLRVREQVVVSLPSAYVQISIVAGLFTALRVQRLNHAYLLVDQRRKDEVKVAITPGFAMLRLPRKARTFLLIMAGVSFLMALTDGPLLLMALVIQTVFVTCYALIGAAVVCGFMMRKDPDKRVMGGVLAAALYLLMPSMLMVLGVFERFLRLKSNPDDTSDDTHQEENEEEER
ncbi:MAG: hypothetical protein E7319_03900 [Clostridiales bacterium]|nr:hypothetical protein [Clostridiales bacterium]